MKNLIISSFALLFSLFATQTNADDYGIFTLRSVDLDVINFFPNGVDPLVTQNGIPNRTVGQYLGVQLNTDVYKVFYWDTLVHSATDTISNPDGSTAGGQFREVGLQLQLGVNLTDFFQVGYYHHSQHVLDTPYMNNAPFPREDGLEFKLNIYRVKEPRQGIF